MQNESNSTVRAGSSGFALVVLLALSGCAGHREFVAPGVTAAGPDKEAVTVISAVPALTTSGITNSGVIDVRPEPDLAQAFERALERHVTNGTFRIVTAHLEVRTVLAKQTVGLDMVVETGGRSFRAREIIDDAGAGLGGRFLQQVPVLLERAAFSIAQQSARED